MKVEQEGTGFVPITITLESQEEANIMWAMLNAPWSEVMNNASYVVTTNDIRILSCKEIAYLMFCVFDDVHPEEKQ